MKPKLLFLAKLSAFSLGLFLIWDFISTAYISVLSFVLHHLNFYYNSSAEWHEYLYKRTLYLIPFASLVCATPKMTIKRKAAIIAIGVIVFLLMDLLFLQYMLYLEREGNEDLSDVIFQSIEWIMSFLLWLIPGYPYLGELFNKQEA